MNILDYLATEFATFEEKPFNPLDSAILSQFCMVRLEGIVPALRNLEAFPGLPTFSELQFSVPGSALHFTEVLRAELYETMFTGLVPGLVKENMIALAASPRFRDMVVQDYLSLFDNTLQTQFAAMTFAYKDQFVYVGYRGTDSSFTGWKEDFNMACTSPIPSQEHAVHYLEAIAATKPKRLIVGGHSKGANLAVYAALRANIPTQQHIEIVYSHDGPGFKPGVFDAPTWAALEGRIHRTVPQESIIGMFMETAVPPRVVKSTEHGIMQHSIFSWDITSDDFVYVDAVADSSLFTQTVLIDWLAGSSDSEVAIIGKALFDAIEASGAQDISELLSGGVRSIALLTEAAKNTDDTTRDTLIAAAKTLTEIATRRATQGFVDMLTPKPKDERTLPLLNQLPGLPLLAPKDRESR